MECNQGFLWISSYFSANLILTIHNKWVMTKSGFDFPWTLTAIHISLSGLGAYLLCKMNRKEEETEPLIPNNSASTSTSSSSQNGKVKLALFSFLYAMNIAVSNLSLSYVSLALHQIVRSATPIFTVGLDYMVRSKNCTRWEMLSLLPVIVGIILATLKPSAPANDVRADNMVSYAYGITMTIFGVALSALKGIVTNAMLSGPQRYDPLELIWKTAILSSGQCLFFGVTSGELNGIYNLFHGSPAPWSIAGQVFVNGTLAFFLNWVSFTANAKTSALSMTVAGNVKQALLIILAIYIFNTHISSLNFLGIVITVAGGCWYSILKYRNQVENDDDQQEQQPQQKLSNQ